MKTTISIILTLFLFSCSQKNTDEIKATFNNYKKAILNDDANLAFENIDKQTKEYYSWVAESCKKFTEQEIKPLGLLDKMQVMLIRHRIPKENLLKK